MLFALIFPRTQRASTYDNSAERNVWLQSALRSFAIVCDYMETDLFAIVCDLRSAIRDRLGSFAIIWKPAFSLYGGAGLRLDLLIFPVIITLLLYFVIKFVEGGRNSWLPFSVNARKRDYNINIPQCQIRASIKG